MKGVFSGALFGLTVAAALAVTSGAAVAKKFDDVTLTIATFGGPWADRLTAELKDKMAAEGITMKFVGGGTEEFLAQLIAARGQTPPFDVVEVSEATYPDLLRGEFLQKLDLSAIPNKDQLAEGMYNDYRVGYWATEPGILYNIEKLKAAGIAPPQHYSDLANPALAGRVLLSDITGYMGYYQVLGLAYENGGSVKDPQPGFDKMAEIKPHSYSGSVATTLQLFKSGDVWVGAFPAHLGIRMAKAGIDMAAVHPVIDGHKGALSLGYLAVPARSPNKAAAEFFINAVIDQTVQKNLYEWAATIPTNTNTMKQVIGDLVLDSEGRPFLQMDPAVVAKTWQPDLSEVNKRNWVRSWQRAVAAQQ